MDDKWATVIIGVIYHGILRSLLNHCCPEVGFVCRFACNPGYSLVGSPTVVCQRNGQWSARPVCVSYTATTTCTPLTTTSTTTQQPVQAYSPGLEEPTNGVMVGSCGVSPPASVCKFSCNTGYQLTGNPVRQCQSSGQWTNSDVQCTARVKCPSLTAPTNGVLYGYCSPGTYYNIKILKAI